MSSKRGIPAKDRARSRTAKANRRPSRELLAPDMRPGRQTLCDEVLRHAAGQTRHRRALAPTYENRTLVNRRLRFPRDVARFPAPTLRELRRLRQRETRAALRARWRLSRPD